MRARGRACLVIVLALAAGCGARGTKEAAEPSAGGIDVMRLSKPSREHLQKIREHIGKQEWDAALRELERMKKREHIDDYERAVMWQTFGAVHFQKGEFEQAARAGEEALRLGTLPEGVRLETLRLLGELYVLMERFDRASELLAEWIGKVPDPKPEGHYLVASAYAAQKRFAEALPHAERAVQGMTDPKEEWLKLLVSLHYERKHDREVLAVLERLVGAFPKNKSYRLQSVEALLALDRDAEALAAMERAHADGLLDEEKDLTNLATLYIEGGRPLNAARLLDVHLREGKMTRTPGHLHLLARAWSLAGDESRAQESKQAAEALDAPR